MPDFDWKAIDRETEAAEASRKAPVAVEDIAKIIDPHSFMDIPFTDDPVLLDMVEQSKQDAIRKAERILSALSQPADERASIVCDVLTIQHSSGFPDHFTRIKVGDRQLTTYMSKIKGRCEYHAAEFDWLLNGADKPNILAFDYTEPEGLSDYLKSIHPADERVVEALPSDLVGRIVDDAIIRCRELPDYAGRPAWEAAIDAAIRAALAQEGRKNG